MSAKLNLYLIRHAKAFPKGEMYPKDGLRPLTDEGRQQAQQLQQALARLGIEFDRVLSSSWIRASQTAAYVADSSPTPITTLPELANNNFPALLTALRCFEHDNAHIALVGHQPWLEQFASWLVTGKSKAMRLNVKKSSIIKISGVLNAGKMKLQWLIPPFVTATIASIPQGSAMMEILSTASLEDALEDFTHEDFTHEDLTHADPNDGMVSDSNDDRTR